MIYKVLAWAAEWEKVLINLGFLTFHRVAGPDCGFVWGGSGGSDCSYLVAWGHARAGSNRVRSVGLMPLRSRS
ncbi:hypothetical protein PMIT1303_00607 [Prochlorococcus sp. MIT 1303]|nr:hypothetical protein PMIT1303_00607 [Prochlorococcus sp. MIT 1303]